MLHNLFKSLEKIIRFRCYAASDDKLSPPGKIDGSGSSFLATRGKVGTTAFKNFLATMHFPYNDSISGEHQADVIYTRTTPVGDADWQALPIGSITLQHVVAATVVTDAGVYIKTITGAFEKFLTTDQNTIDTSATDARAGTRWDGLRIKSKVPTGVTCAGEQTGLYIETEVTGTGICSGSHYGLKIETYVVSTATITGDHYGAGIFTYDDRAGSNQLHVLRLEHNGANVGNAFLGCFAAAGKMNYLLESSTTDDSWMSIGTTPTCGTAAGWERVKYGGYVRYRQLYSAVS